MKKFIIAIILTITMVAIGAPSMIALADEPALDNVVITPASAAVVAGHTQQFTAVARDSDNNTISSVNLTWAVVNGGGTINATSGLFTANQTGTFTDTVKVTATQDSVNKTAYATVTVTSVGPLDHVVISPASASVIVNHTQQFTAVAQDSFNGTISSVNLTWAVVNGGGTINATSGLFTAGNVTGTYANTVQVTATQGSVNKTALATVTVTPTGILDHVVVVPQTTNLTNGQTKQFTAIAKDADNNNLTSVNFTWAVVNGGGTINTTSGLFTANGTVNTTYTNTVQVTATQGSITKTSYATVKIVKANGKHDDDEDEDDDDEREDPKGWEHGKKTGWGDNNVPPGFSHGKKNGWNGENRPPAWFKIFNNLFKGKSNKNDD